MSSSIDPIMHRDYTVYESARACEVGATISAEQFLEYTRAHRRWRIPAQQQPGHYCFGGGYSFTKNGDDWIAQAPLDPWGCGNGE